MSSANAAGLVAAAAALVSLVVAPALQRVIASIPPDPEDDPAPVPRAGPWLARRRLFGPLVAAVAAAVAYRTGATPVVAAHVVVAIGLLTLSVIDVDLFLLPKKVVYPVLGLAGALLVVAAVAGHDGDDLRRALLGSAGAWLALLVVHLISPGGMGFGDVRLAAIIGLDLGWIGAAQVVAGLFAGFAAASVVGVVLLASRRKGRRDAVPFGPFMAVGALFILLGGDALLGLAR